MNDQYQNNLNFPELSGEKGWTELIIPDSYGKGRAFITGDWNGDRIRVRYFQKDNDNSFVARVWFGPATEGPAGFVHGGSMAAVLDEAMRESVWLLTYTVAAAKITVEYRKMLPLDTVTTIEANIASENGRKIISKGKIYNETGTVYTESEGLYINIPSEKFGEMIKYQNGFQRS